MPAPQAMREGQTTLRLDLAVLGGSLQRSDAGVEAGMRLAAAYAGERRLVLGFGGVRIVRPGALSKLLRASIALLEPWGPEARVELQGLRPALRRTALLTVADRPEVAVVAVRRRSVVVAPSPDTCARAAAARAEVNRTRRKMLLLGTRDGERCVWCGKGLSHRCVDATVDHVRCRSAGGSNALDNLLLACAACNNARSNRPADLWLERCVAAGLAVDVDVVRDAIRRSQRLDRARIRRAVRRAEAAPIADAA